MIYFKMSEPRRACSQIGVGMISVLNAALNMHDIWRRLGVWNNIRGVGQKLGFNIY